jgi:hypothetical protein
VRRRPGRSADRDALIRSACGSVEASAAASSVTRSHHPRAATAPTGRRSGLST